LKKRNLFAVIAIIVFCLLFYAMGVVLHLVASFIFAPDIEAILAEVVAVILLVVMFYLDFIEKRRGTPLDSHRTDLSSISARENVKHVESDPEVIQSVKVQKSTIKVEAAKAEQNQSALVKQLITHPTYLICPVCRKEFSLPIYERDYIVDFGPPKQSNLIKHCLYCGASISLKRIGTVEEEGIWKD
jgi:uncharacterized membrane protein